VSQRQTVAEAGAVLKLGVNVNREVKRIGGHSASGKAWAIPTMLKCASWLERWGALHAGGSASDLVER